MNAGTATFVIVLTLIGTLGWVINNWIQARNSWNRGSADNLAADRRAELLEAENARLKGQVGRLEDRIAVLERIATDPAERVSRQIDELRRDAE